MNITFNVICTSTSDSYSSTYYDYNYYGYSAPSNDDSYTSLQNLFDFYIKSNSVYSGINKATLRGRVQYKTITSNGTYYPYNTSTFIKKIVVNVPAPLKTAKAMRPPNLDSAAVYFTSFSTNTSTNFNLQVNANRTAVCIRKLGTEGYYIDIIYNNSTSTYTKNYTEKCIYYRYTGSINYNFLTVYPSNQNALLQVPFIDLTAYPNTAGFKTITIYPLFKIPELDNL